MESPAVVIIVLIVLIVTGCQNEAKPFSLINAMQFLSIEIRGNPAVVIIVLIVLIVLIVTPIPDPFCYQKFINYTGRTRLIFTNIYVIITVIDVSFVSCYASCNSPQIPDLTPLIL